MNVGHKGCDTPDLQEPNLPIYAHLALRACMSHLWALLGVSLVPYSVEVNAQCVRP